MKRAFVLCALVSFATSAFAKDAFLVIGGSVSNFRTDMRVFNPSTTKDIQIQATLLPVNVAVPNPADNRNAQSVTINVPKRQMVTYDDVVSTLFSASGLGAIHLKSADDFVATQRIYAIQASSAACQIAGTLGQFVPAADLASAKTAGVLIQLKANASFRTNVGLVNPNSVNATVTWKLYDKNNALVSTGTPVVVPPLGVVGPTRSPEASSSLPVRRTSPTPGSVLPPISRCWRTPRWSTTGPAILRSSPWPTTPHRRLLRSLRRARCTT
jgi:hypothetical protein